MTRMVLGLTTRKMIGAIAIAILAPLCASAAPPKLYPGWSAVQLEESDAIETRFHCVGDECAGSTLQCVYFRRTVQMPEDIRTEDLVGTRFTWGQFEFWLAKRYWDERHDIQPGLEAVSRAQRVEEPNLKKVDETSYIGFAYTTKVRERDAVLPVALWVKGREVRGLRCSYLAIAGEDTMGRIAQLLELVIAQ